MKEHQYMTERERQILEMGVAARDSGKDADRAVKTISNLRQQIIELELML